jgi:hypothetical protein
MAQTERNSSLLVRWSLIGCLVDIHGGTTMGLSAIG